MLPLLKEQKNGEEQEKKSTVQNYSASTSTGNLKQHLENVHKIRDTEAFAKASSNATQSFFR
ncbi:hypothetical protein Bhyg_05247 [Pseudolycoriella hygida]|uniref:Uncharacterized protein n=1 Tax=Pseudolycoriella hygida TaxID=35572 RepID=A0A9Q0S914_9DIPT|nr:hypothetical protein Bhyg_05247 [Pseudolycoriella hygida]